ncbi:hypothetical protein CC85DRAFT_200784 [Cutaneotrichosporon oleaginosum]|uniref:Uncharacterized protein n=1 Tax=Cutaneotrichosporon oleaginosum TaxID=879819 RepID=A0A0J0XU89_9TREE|nr:uncharacterized protein CC85DRAFT_200784 [Cutaneotrichosporon oleaginosum]KLT44630.1 hypothetical protein CC85DRAFT_200784 [Cutaneotrichosporon oleaginosum]TXT07616.1 hypothetical protein COLE_04540 [Cutaneotrichosporon oleaginosum]
MDSWRLWDWVLPKVARRTARHCTQDTASEGAGVRGTQLTCAQESVCIAQLRLDGTGATGSPPLCLVKRHGARNAGSFAGVASECEPTERSSPPIDWV